MVITRLFFVSMLFLFVLIFILFFIYFFFHFIYLFIFNLTIMYWFCHISKWICHRYTCVPHPEPFSLLPPHKIPLGRPSAPAPSIQYCASNLDWRLVSYMMLGIHTQEFLSICRQGHCCPLWFNTDVFSPSTCSMKIASPNHCNNKRHCHTFLISPWSLGDSLSS